MESVYCKVYRNMLVHHHFRHVNDTFTPLFIWAASLWSALRCYSGWTEGTKIAMPLSHHTYAAFSNFIKVAYILYVSYRLFAGGERMVNGDSKLNVRL